MLTVCPKPGGDAHPVAHEGAVTGATGSVDGASCVFGISRHHSVKWDIVRVAVSRSVMDAGTFTAERRVDHA